MRVTLSVLATVALVGAAGTSFTRAADTPDRLSLRFAPGVTYARTESTTHNVIYDLNKTLRRLTGSKSDPVTISETRSRSLLLNANGSVKISETNTRRYVDKKDKSVITRHADYNGTLSADGKRNPPPGFLGDAGDGALDELPDQPIAAGQTWTFSRNFLIDRSLGQGVMKYTDKVERIEMRGRKRFAIISVSGAGRADLAKDLRAKGFHTSDVALTGTAEFNISDGLPAAQHYTARGSWYARIMFAKIGVIFNDTYEAQPWTRSSAGSTR